MRSSRWWRGNDSSASTKLACPSMVPPIITFSQHRGFADHARGLEGAGDAARGAQRRHARRQLVVAERHGAALGGVIAGDHVERRGLAAAVGADQAVDPAGLHVEIEAVDGADIAEAQRDAAQAERLAAGALAQRCRRARPDAARWRGCWQADGGCGNRATPRCRRASPARSPAAVPHRGRSTTPPSGAAISGRMVRITVPSSGPMIEPRPPIRMAMKNSTERSKVNASGVM